MSFHSEVKKELDLYRLMVTDSLEGTNKSGVPSNARESRCQTILHNLCKIEKRHRDQKTLTDAELMIKYSPYLP